jgi:hypothetical protein
MRAHVIAVGVAALSLSPFASAVAEFSDPRPIGSGEILIQYETTPTERQAQVCTRLGGEITQLRNGTYVCVRRST